MATESLYYNFNITDPVAADRFADAVEELERLRGEELLNKKNKPDIRLPDQREIDEFMNRWFPDV